MHLPVNRRLGAGFFSWVAAGLMAAAPVHAAALEAVSSDGRFRVETDEATMELVVRSGDGARELRRIPLRDRGRRAGRLAWILDLPARGSFLTGFEALPEAWELPYGAKAEPVFDGLVHDYRMGEGIADTGPLPVRRIPLDAPLPLPTPDAKPFQVTWPDPRNPGRLNVLNLDVRRVVAQIEAPTRSDAPVVVASAPPSPQPQATPGTLPKIEKVQVVAAVSRVQEAVESVPATVSVIEREDAFREVAGNLRDLVRYEPGVSIEGNSTRFGLGNFNIRGLEGNRVQMTVDGIRLPESYRVGSFSNASRNALGIGLLRQVEIVRGPSSAIHGSDALGGVIAFTTLDPTQYLAAGKAVGGEAFGAYASADESAGGGGAIAIAAGGTQLLVGAEGSRGHEVANMGTVGGTGASRTEPNPQETRTGAQLVKWVIPTESGWRYTLVAERFNRDVRTDVLSLNPQSSKTVSLTGDDGSRRRRYSAEAVGYETGPFARASLTAYYQTSEVTQATEEIRANTTAACLSATGTVRCLRAPTFTYDVTDRGVVAIGEANAGWWGLAHRIVAGAEYSRMTTAEKRDGTQTNLNTGQVSNVVGGEALPTRDFPVTDTDRFGTFVQDSFEALDPRLTWIPGLRFDYYRLTPQNDEVFAAGSPGRPVVGLRDQAFSPKLGILFRPSGSFSWTGQLATGYRAPPAADLNIGLTSLPAGYTVIPNPDLVPERSVGAEGGFRVSAPDVDGMLTAYYTRYHDLIVSRAALPCPADPRCVPGATGTFQSQNISEARIYGLEGRLAWRFARGWTARAAFSLPRGDDLSKGQPLNTIEPPRLVAGLGYETAAWGAMLHTTHAWEQSRVDPASGVNFVPPSWTTVDLTAWWKPLPALEIAAGAFNLGDEKYWLWSDVRGLTNVTVGFDRYTQPGRNYGVNARWTF